MSTFLNYINESIAELRHIRWPTRQQAIRLSLIVIVFIAVNAAAFGFVDFVLAELLNFILSTT